MAFTKDTREISLSKVMRQLWQVHVQLTRDVIRSIAQGDDVSMKVSQLMANQTDIGNQFIGKYDQSVADKVTTLLQDHIRIAGRLVMAVKNGDEKVIEHEKVLWFRNADDIANALSSIGPDNGIWDYEKLKKALYLHLNLTIDEAVCEIKGNGQRGLGYYLAALQQINQIADTLSLGLLQTIALHGQHLMGLLY